MNDWTGPVKIAYFNKLVLTGNIIRNNLTFKGSGGIYVNNSEVYIVGNLIENNRAILGSQNLCSGGISVSKGRGFIKRNIIRNNYAPYKGGGLVSTGSKMNISENIISRNYSDGDAGGIFLWYGNDTLVNNIIANNTSKNGRSITLTNAPTVLAGNLICNNDYGIYSSNSDLIMINNTIVNNEGDGLELREGNLDMRNCIVSGHRYEINNGSTYEQVSIHNCQIQDGEQGIYGSQSADIQNLLGSDPAYVNPTPDKGPLYDGLLADYSLQPVSDGINMGTEVPAGLLTDYDLKGMARFHSRAIDIGAYETHGEPPVITRHPFGGKYCNGDTLILFTEAADTSLYQWVKDGIDLAGQISQTLRIYYVNPESEGNYYCRVSNAFDTVETFPAYIRYNIAPNIYRQPDTTWVVAGEEAKLSVNSTGLDLEYQWYKGGSPIINALASDYLFSIPDSSGEGEYYCKVSNYCGTVQSDPASVWLAPQICMVTVSEITGHNLVVWEKKSTSPILAYNLYRESAAAGIFDLLATVPFDDLSVFVDTNADPTVQSYIYKLAALTGTSENETDIDLCKPHKTVHLLVTTNPEFNTTQLAWDRYYGFDYQTYTIYRSITGMNFEPVHSLSASNNSWADDGPEGTDLFYRIAVEKPIPCEPEGSGKKAGTGPYRHSLSNMDDNKLKDGQLPPDTIVLNNQSIAEGLPAGTVIGKLITEDGDSIDSHTYKFVPGEGDKDNLSFTLLGDLLLASESFTYETQNQYSIRIRSTDEAGNYCEVPFVILILPATGIYEQGDGMIKIFPNPFSQSTIISFPNPGRETYRMVLTDLSGKVCRIVNEIKTSEFELKN